jgi:uncharacterized protein (UPF0332 family)
VSETNGALLEKARECLADAAALGAERPRIAGREAYLAAFHAAQAMILHRTGRIAKSHRGVRVEFARIAHADPAIPSDLVTFLAQAYELKSLADYGTAADPRLDAATAAAAIAGADRFLAAIASLLPPDPP